MGRRRESQRYYSEDDDSICSEDDDEYEMIYPEERYRTARNRRSRQTHNEGEGWWPFSISNRLFAPSTSNRNIEVQRARDRKRLSSKKARKSSKSKRYLPQTSYGWGLLCLSVFLVLYLMDFLAILSEQPAKTGRDNGRRKHSSGGEHYRAPAEIPKAERHQATLQNAGNEDPVNTNDAKGEPASSAGEPRSNESLQKVGSNPAAEDIRPSHESGKGSSDSDDSSDTRGSGDEKKSDPSLASSDMLLLPMNRQNKNLQVPGETGPLSVDHVKSFYRKLAKAYVQPFASGIYRNMFFDVLRRRTYALTPPGANKGIQSMMFQIIDSKVYMMDPYEVPKNSKPFYRTRINELIWLLSKLASAGRIKNTEFMVSIHDCVQTVNKPHMYRGATYQESIPAFTIVSCNFSDNIPFPMWEGDEGRGGGLARWDERMVEYGRDGAEWSSKDGRAVFRGGHRPSMYFRNKSDSNSHCDAVGRTRLAHLASSHHDFLDVSVGGTCGGKHSFLTRMNEKEQQKFKYIVYAEGNCFWADRLNKQVFGPSLIVKQETPCGQFWEPMLSPMTHYVPTDFFFNDLMDRIRWARTNDQEVRKIIRNANEFAKNFLSLRGIEAYVEVLLEEYTALLVEPNIKVENGARDVTNQRV